MTIVKCKKESLKNLNFSLSLALISQHYTLRFVLLFILFPLPNNFNISVCEFWVFRSFFAFSFWIRQSIIINCVLKPFEYWGFFFAKFLWCICTKIGLPFHFWSACISFPYTCYTGPLSRCNFGLISFINKVVES